MRILLPIREPRGLTYNEKVGGMRVPRYELSVSPRDRFYWSTPIPDSILPKQTPPSRAHWLVSLIHQSHLKTFYGIGLTSAGAELVSHLLLGLANAQMAQPHDHRHGKP